MESGEAEDRGQRTVDGGGWTVDRKPVGCGQSAVFVASHENLPAGAVGACLERRRERPRTDRVDGGRGR